jgi:hypothetical protein
VVSNLIDQNPDTFAAVEMHLQDAFATSWGNQRQSFYGVTSIPNLRFDGGPDAWPYTTYAAKLASAQAVPTDVTIELTGQESGTQQFEVRARVCIEPGGADKTMRIFMVHVLDHWPVSPTYSRNTVRLGAVAEDVSLIAGSCGDVTRTFTFDGTSWSNQDNIGIVAWAQQPTANPAPVYQAAQMKWPFPLPAEVFASTFEDGTTDDWSLVEP